MAGIEELASGLAVAGESGQRGSTVVELETAMRNFGGSLLKLVLVLLAPRVLAVLAFLAGLDILPGIALS